MEPTTAESALAVQTASAGIFLLLVLATLLAVSAVAYYVYRARRSKRARLSKRAVREVELPTTTNPMSPHATSPVRALAKAPEVEAAAML